jgi:hypothetical protein
VHPALVAANRNHLVSLVATNLLGQNAPAIAAAEAVYEQMWAQDVAVMAAYHADASAVAMRLVPFGEGLQQLLQNLPGQAASAYAASGLPALTVDWRTRQLQPGDRQHRRQQQRHRQPRRWPANMCGSGHRVGGDGQQSAGVVSDADGSCGGVAGVEQQQRQESAIRVEVSVSRFRCR